MAITLTPTVLTGAVASVSVVVAGVEPSIVYDLDATAADGRVYNPRGFRRLGGTGYAVIDSVFPLDGPVTYSLREYGTTAALATATIDPAQTYSEPVELVSYDGTLRIATDLASDRADGLGIAYTMRRTAVDVAGSGVRFATWDVPIKGGPSVSFRVQRDGLAAVENLVESGAPIYMRTLTGWAGGVPSAGIWGIDAASYAFEGISDGVETYLWTLGLVPAMDPTPRRGVAISSWQDFNDAMVRLGWDYTDLQNFLATFGSWAEASTVDWSQM